MGTFTLYTRLGPLVGSVDPRYIVFHVVPICACRDQVTSTPHPRSRWCRGYAGTMGARLRLVESRVVTSTFLHGHYELCLLELCHNPCAPVCIPKARLLLVTGLPVQPHDKWEDIGGVKCARHWVQIPKDPKSPIFSFTVCMSRRGVCVWIAAKGWGGSGHICSPVVHQHAVLVRAGAL